MPDRAEMPGHSENSECPFFLSETQTEVLALVAQGYTGVDIGVQLNYAPRTIRAHLQEIREILGVANTIEAVVVALYLGLIELDHCLRPQMIALFAGDRQTEMS